MNIRLYHPDSILENNTSLLSKEHTHYIVNVMRLKRGSKLNFFNKNGEWLPEETLETLRSHLVGIKGPLTTPIGGGIRSLNVALRKELDLYACVRPVRWFRGTPAAILNPQRVDFVLFRENTEDVYAGIEFENGTEIIKESKLVTISDEDKPKRREQKIPECKKVGPATGEAEIKEIDERK